MILNNSSRVKFLPHKLPDDCKEYQFVKACFPSISFFFKLSQEPKAVVFFLIFCVIIFFHFDYLCLYISPFVFAVMSVFVDWVEHVGNLILLDKDVRDSVLLFIYSLKDVKVSKRL